MNFAATHDSDKKLSEITIYGDIGESWFWDSTSAADVDNALKEAGDNDVLIKLNSPGGSAFDGIAIYNSLIAHKGKVTVRVDGWACSAASIIAMAADELYMGKGTMLMIHEASTIVWGTKSAFIKEAELLEKLEAGIVDIYMTKANTSREDIIDKMNAETWFTADEAVAIGFANALIVEDDQAAEEIQNLKRLNNKLQAEIEALKNNPGQAAQEDPIEDIQQEKTSNAFLKFFQNN